MNFLESLLLGIVQGLTEFLPVSSSGHIELGKILLGVKVKDPLLFSIVVHAATALSTIVIYWKDIVTIIRDFFRITWNPSTRFVYYILISMIPVGLVGGLFEDQINALFEGKLLLVGCMLLLTGGLLWFSSRAKAMEGELTGIKAFIIGVAQAIAILPGISRSGSTISTALILGVDREKAARFSFLMVLPPILGATAIKLYKYLKEPVEATAAAGTEDVGLWVLVVGFVSAFVAGLLACQWMIRIVKRSKLDYFAIYCWIVGLIAIVGSFMVVAS
ncbi:MAG: undecaprenyl-diphosphate phosphatase [Bacteroidota bacterium]